MPACTWPMSASATLTRTVMRDRSAIDSSGGVWYSALSVWPALASTEITVGGGATQSALWMQIHADTAGLPVRIPASADAPSTGSAVLASHGAGRFASIDEGIAAMVRPGTTIDPRPREMAMYDEIYRRYLALYPALKGALA